MMNGSGPFPARFITLTWTRMDDSAPTMYDDLVALLNDRRYIRSRAGG